MQVKNRIGHFTKCIGDARTCKAAVLCTSRPDMSLSSTFALETLSVPFVPVIRRSKSDNPEISLGVNLGALREKSQTPGIACRDPARRDVANVSNGRMSGLTRRMTTPSTSMSPNRRCIAAARCTATSASQLEPSCIRTGMKIHVRHVVGHIGHGTSGESEDLSDGSGTDGQLGDAKSWLNLQFSQTNHLLRLLTAFDALDASRRLSA